MIATREAAEDLQGVGLLRHKCSAKLRHLAVKFLYITLLTFNEERKKEREREKGRKLNTL